ncbi:MAG: minor capsid protein [Syntrophomonadaceae bacterium]|nr:minor capsid protein [Syntrophomonadaceae bacterium]
MADNLQKEILTIKNLIETQADKDMKPIIKAFRESLNNIRLEIAKLYAKYGDLKTMSQAERTKELRKLESFILEKARELNIIESTTTEQILKKSYEDTYHRTFFIVQTGVSAEIPLTILSDKFVNSVVNQKFVEERFSDRIWTNKKLLISKLNKTIKSGVIQGKSIDKMTRDIKNTFGQSAFISQRLVRTETARVQTDANMKLYDDCGLVKKVLYDATLDNKTSDICKSRDGKYWDIDDLSKPKIPAHPNCRSCWIPVINGWKPRTKRDNITKEIIPYQTYEEWAKEKGIK